jgi:hypothetical protein
VCSVQCTVCSVYSVFIVCGPDVYSVYSLRSVQCVDLMPPIGRKEQHFSLVEVRLDAVPVSFVEQRKLIVVGLAGIESVQ